MLTPGPLCFFQNRSLAQSEFTYFPSGHFVFTLHYCKVGQSTHPRRAFLTPLCHCLVHAMTTTTTSEQWVNSEEVECLGDIWADGHISQTWGCTQMNTRVTERRAMNDLLNKVALRQKYMKVQDHSFHTDTRSFGTCWQAAHIKAICSSCWVNCALKANEPLNGIEPRPPLPDNLGCFVPHQCDNSVQICPNELSQRGTKFIVLVFILNKMFLTVSYLFALHSVSTENSCQICKEFLRKTKHELKLQSSEMLSVEFVRIDELLNKKRTNFFLVTDIFPFCYGQQSECSRTNGERLMRLSSSFASITKTLGMSHIV